MTTIHRTLLLTESLSDYIAYLNFEKGLAECSIDAYKTDLTHYLKFLQEELCIKNVKHILSTHILSFIEALTVTSIASSSISRILSSIRSYHQYLVMEGICEDDVTYSIPFPKCIKKLPNVLNYQEVCQILDAPSTKDSYMNRDQAILELLYGTGMRVSELTALTLSDIFFEKKYVKVMGKGSKERLIPINKKALNSLSLYINKCRICLKRDYRDTKNKVFLNSYGGPLTRVSVWTITKKYALRAGIKKHIYPHIFRHSCATHLLERGADIRIVQRILGHVSISTTDIYLHITNRFLHNNYYKYHPRA